MTVGKVPLLSGLLALGTVTALWLQSRGRSSERALVQPASGELSATPAAGVPARESGERVATTARAQASEPPVPAAAVAELLERVAETSYARAGGAFVDYFVARGLARSDSERIVRDALTAGTHCLFDALRFEAEAQSVSFGSLLDALEAEIYDADGPPLGALIDMNALQARQAPCVTTVLQQAGIPVSDLEQAVRAASRVAR